MNPLPILAACTTSALAGYFLSAQIGWWAIPIILPLAILAGKGAAT